MSLSTSTVEFDSLEGSLSVSASLYYSAIAAGLSLTDSSYQSSETQMDPSVSVSESASISTSEVQYDSYDPSLSETIRTSLEAVIDSLSLTDDLSSLTVEL
ncbi:MULTISPECIES: hypothetical protein [Streptococcus]|uniref:Uncharacterized protein n=2 Tax=Streptococcus parasuis TaxID=1501662 RepID=A0ABV2EQW5_9STRE|nr:hypothetical protein [Streptococcus parasuis]BCP60730.1 hypothetical protein SUT286_20560 [Streptococcus parasuis]